MKEAKLSASEVDEMENVRWLGLLTM